MAVNRTPKKALPPYQFVDSVPVARIFLALSNPRHEPVQSEADAILRLCTKEDVYPLARDIVRYGLSPLERFALTTVGKTSAANPSYYVDEGNRRICALKLLGDPELAPPKFRASFEKLAEKWIPITHVAAAVFNDVNTLRVWLDRVHSGPQGGVGRKTWDAEQKQRFFGGSKNKLAQSVLDYAEAEKMITKAERQGKLTTAARFLNPMFQEIIGLDRSKTDELGRTRPKAEFDIMLRKFMRDLVEETDVTSRKNRPEIIQYARTLGAMVGVSNNRIDSEPLADDGNGRALPTKRPGSTPRKPEKARHVRHDDEIFKALKSYRNDKLSSLYYSICALELERNTPIACIGAWAFFETLTACQGRHEKTNFEAYLSKAKLITFGLTGDTQAVRLAVGRILAYGNFTKHHPTSATFNGDQLNNDMITLKDIILKCIEEAAARP